MKPPKNFSKVIGLKRYSTDSAELIADDAYWDGNNFERQGRNTFLYLTKKGNYFVVALSQWQNEQNELRPISEDEAIHLWEGQLSEHYASFEDAFPGITIEDA